jgi:hypothetical protein
LSLPSIQALAVSGTVAIAVFWLAVNRGTFSPTSRGAVAIAVWWTIVLTSALGLARLRRPTWQATTLGGLLLALALWTLASAAWGPNTARAVEEFNRVSLYLGVFVLVVAVGSAVRPARWSDGTAVAIGAVGALSLVTRLVPELANTGAPLRLLPAGQSRLAYPIGYWNALGVLLAMGIPLLLRAALDARSSVARAFAAAILPAFAGVIYLTSSRAGSLAALTGLVIFVLLCNRRVAAAVLLVLAGAGGVLVVAEISGKPSLVNGPLNSAAAASQGHAALPFVALACLVVGVAWGIGSRRVVELRLAAVERAVAVGTVLLVVGVVLAAHPVRRIDEFKSTPSLSSASASYATSHLLSASGNGRWQMWTVAADEFRAHPLVGGGAGSFQPWWMKERPYALYVVNAHSLFLEVLGELGLVGLILVIGFMGGALGIGGARVRRASPDRRTLAAALVSGLCAYVLGAAVDWMWQMTAVTVVAIVITATLAGARPAVVAVRVRELPAGIGAVVAFVGIAAILSQALPLVSGLELQSSQAEAQKGNFVQAASRAASARSATPWSADPYLQLALIQEHVDALGAARKSVSKATSRAPEDWQVWAIRARIETEAGAVGAARRSLHTAAALNPLWAKAIGATA